MQIYIESQGERGRAKLGEVCKGEREAEEGVLGRGRGGRSLPGEIN